MLSKWVRSWDGVVIKPAIVTLARLGVTPDGLTLASLVAFICAGLAFAAGQALLAVGLMAIGGILDAIDGELARLTQHATASGAFLDSICDHYGDFAIYLGLLWRFLGQDAPLDILLLFCALFGSVMGSQVRSRAGMLGIDTRWTGTFTRFERLVILAAGVLTGQVTVTLAIMAVMTNVSALQRVVYTIQATKTQKP